MKVITLANHKGGGISGGVGGSENRKTTQKNAKKPQTTLDLFPNTETTHTLRPII